MLAGSRQPEECRDARAASGDQAPLNAECSSPCLQSSQAECDVLFLLSLSTDQGQNCTQPFKP